MRGSDDADAGYRPIYHTNYRSSLFWRGIIKRMTLFGGDVMTSPSKHLSIMNFQDKMDGCEL